MAVKLRNQEVDVSKTVFLAIAATGGKGVIPAMNDYLGTVFPQQKIFEAEKDERDMKTLDELSQVTIGELLGKEAILGGAATAAAQKGEQFVIGDESF